MNPGAGGGVAVAGLRSPPAPPNGQDRRTGRDNQEQHPGGPSPYCPRHGGSLLLDFWASVDRYRRPAVEAQDGARPPPSSELYQTVMITTRNGSKQLHSEP